MRTSTFIAAAATLAALAGAAPTRAQVQGQAAAAEPVGYIVAVAGDSAIFNYELDLRVLSRQLPPSPEAQRSLRLAVLDTMVNELLMVQAALRDTTIVIDEASIAARADANLAQEQQRLGGPLQFQQELQVAGFTMEQFRRMRMDQIRKGELVQAYLRKARQETTPPPVAESDIRALYEEELAAGNIPPRPALITVDQIVMAAEPADTALQSATAEAVDVLTRARAGEDWATLVRRHSDEPGSGETLGALGWFRRGDMVRSFEQAVFNRNLRPGDIVGPVQTPFGLHIIRLDKVRGPERQASHILITPTVTPTDVERMRERAVAVADSLRAGRRLADLQERYHDESEDRRIGPAARDSLSGPFAELRTATEGQVVGPLRVEDPRTGTKWVVASVASVEEAGRYTFDELRPQIEQALQQEKVVAEIVAQLRRRMYVDIRLR